MNLFVSGIFLPRLFAHCVPRLISLFVSENVIDFREKEEHNSEYIDNEEIEVAAVI